jgi:hypothetical protein
MAGSPNEVTRETRRCWWAKRANSPRAWLVGVRASVVAEKRVTTVEPRDAGRWKCAGQKDGKENQRECPRGLASGGISRVQMAWVIPKVCMVAVDFVSVSGVWPSPATATSEFSSVPKGSNARSLPNVAAPEDGRTPLNTYQPSRLRVCGASRPVSRRATRRRPNSQARTPALQRSSFRCAISKSWRLSMNQANSARFWSAPVLWRFVRRR